MELLELKIEILMFAQEAEIADGRTGDTEKVLARATRYWEFITLPGGLRKPSDSTLCTD